MEMATSWGLDRISYCRSCGSKYSLASPRFRIAIFQLILVNCFSQMYMQPVWELNIYQDDLCSLCLTCKYFYNLASQPSLWYSIIIVADSHHQYSPIFLLMYLFLITTTISRTEAMLSHFFSLPLSWSLGLPHLSPPWKWSPTLLFLFFTFQGGLGRKICLKLECCLKLRLCSASPFNVIPTQKSWLQV